MPDASTQEDAQLPTRSQLTWFAESAAAGEATPGELEILSAHPDEWRDVLEELLEITEDGLHTAHQIQGAERAQVVADFESERTRLVAALERFSGGTSTLLATEARLQTSWSAGRIVAWGANNLTSFSGGTSTYAAVWNPTTGQFQSVNNNSHSMFCAIPTLLEDGRVFVNGGDGTRERTSTFDFRNNSWSRQQNMSVGRWYNGAVALPNGQVFTMLGDPGNLYPELWTPNVGWSLLTGANLQAPVLNYPTVTEPNNWLPSLYLAPNGQIFHSGHTPQMNYLNYTGNGSVTPVSIRNDWDISNAPTVMYDVGKLLKAGGGAKTNPRRWPTSLRIRKREPAWRP